MNRKFLFVVIGVVAAAGFGMAADQRELVLRQLERSRTAYRTVEDWTKRRAEIREAFLKGAGLWPMPQKSPLQPIVHSRREHDGYSVENLAIETFPGFWCTGNLYRPVGHQGPFAAVLCPHGHFQPLGRMREEQQIRCAHLARMGAVVFSYSMVGWQDSQQTSHSDPLVLALQTVNSLRAVDYVCGLPEVDGKRIGVTGASGGGTQSIYLALLDDRVKACAAAVIVYPWSCPDGCVCEGGLPVMQGAETNIIEYCAAIAPRALLVMSVGGDQTSDFPQVGLPFVQRAYSIHGMAELARNAHFANEQHDYGPSKRKSAYTFFAEHLGLELMEEDTSKIAIEPAEAMAVFDARHPLPATAARGSFEVAKAFGEWTGKGSAVTVSADGTLKKAEAEGEAYFFTPEGFGQEGKAVTASGPKSGRLKIVVREGGRGKSTPCRINVLGADGNYCQPAANRLSEFSLVGQWPEKDAKGNRKDKPPYRYLGRFFYSTGEIALEAPEGPVRIEVRKGYEYRPVTRKTNVAAGKETLVEIEMDRTLDASALGYYGGDTHLHFPRTSEADEQTIFDMLQAEDIRYGSILAYNEPAGPYSGAMDKMAAPQMRGLGERSILARDGYWIMSGQEYRTGTYGHLNLHQREDLLFPGKKFNADNWPVYGEVAEATRKLGGYSVYAHGGYAMEIYADVAQGLIDAVELLQFGVYRGIERKDWYHILNCGYRLPITGASDYPACRYLGDCRTYVEGFGQMRPPKFPEWLKGMAEGRSFATTGPVLLLEVDGVRPGGKIEKSGLGPHRFEARLRVRCEVTPVTDVELIVNGRMASRRAIPKEKQVGEWFEWRETVEVSESSWIAARAFSTTPGGQPNAEAHTNPVYVIVDGKMPYRRESLDAWVEKIDGQIAAHSKRMFPEKAKVLNYFQKSRDLLLRVREMGGLAEGTKIADLVAATKTENTSVRDLGADGSVLDATEEELKAFLRPVPAKTPEEQLKTFETAAGFEMQLVASEPMVFNPIAGTIDEDGNLFVCEMTDYPYKPVEGKLPIGSVRMLRDTDGDGRMDESHLFAEHLLWAGGVAAWRGGVFVAAPPDIWYMRDTNGDGKADIRLQVFTGFGTQNQQAMLNNLTWWLDHKIYGSTAGNGGTIRPGDRWTEYMRIVEGKEGAKPSFESLLVKGHDFRFDPRTGQFETLTGTEQFGTTFDDWGNRFICDESNPLHHVVLPEEYLKRNPYLIVPAAIKNVAPSPVPIHRISPVERWRHIRSSRRVLKGERSALGAGASHHVIDAGAGVTVYRGGAYGRDFCGDVFIGDGQNNLVHHRRLIPDGASFTSERVETSTEFVRSSDLWFRPVNFINAPDGTLYCLDMSREVLETIHIPLDVVKHLDLTSGRDHGRVYRIAPARFQSPAPPKLGKATTAELVKALESPHGWWRDTACRLMYERQDRAAIGPLEKLVKASAQPQTRLAALWTLSGLSALRDEVTAIGLGDEVAGVRENSVRLAERTIRTSPELLTRVLAMAKDKNARVRMQVAFTLGETTDARSAEALADLAKESADDPWMRTAVLSSSGALAGDILLRLLAEDAVGQSAGGRIVLDQLAVLVGSRKSTGELERVLSALAEKRGTLGDAFVDRLLRGIGAGLKRTGVRLAPPDKASGAVAALVGELSTRSREVALDESKSEDLRAEAIATLSAFPFEQARETLMKCLDAKAPVGVQTAAVRALSEYPEEGIGEMLLARWAQYAPVVRAEAMSAMLAREDRTIALLRAAAAGKASVAELEPSRRELLLRHRNPEIADKAKRVFEASNPERSKVVAEYREALSLKGDASKGEKVFEKNCMGCHKVGSKGNEVGPNLASSPSRDPAALVENILDPNRHVLPNYVQYVVLDSNGKSYSGVVASQTATSVTLKREKDATDTILLADVEEMTSTGRSLMPEGLEKSISKGEMADLVAYLATVVGTNEGASEGDVKARDFGTEPGLIEPGR